MKIQLTALTILFLTSSQCYANWASGGGLLEQETTNPWFVKNTKTVRYCVGIDQENFGAPIALAKQQIRSAINYWKSEITPDVTNDTERVTIGLASQNFVEVACDQPDIDLSVQLGYLTPDQNEKISDIKHYAALTIRTEYDKINLKGKGFIFISAEKGAFAPNQKLFANHWTYRDGKLLEIMMIHEFGHIFGTVDKQSSLTWEKIAPLIFFMPDRMAEIMPHTFQILEGTRYATSFSDNKFLFGKADKEFTYGFIKKEGCNYNFYTANENGEPIEYLAKLIHPTHKASDCNANFGSTDAKISFPPEQQIYPEFSGKITSFDLYHIDEDIFTGLLIDKNGVEQATLACDITPARFKCDAVRWENKEYLFYALFGESIYRSTRISNNPDFL